MPTCADVAFQIGPRLNAAGRVAHAAMALQLLLTSDRAEADTLANQLCAQNSQRQEEESRTLEQALAWLRARLDARTLACLTSTEWHPGVIASLPRAW